MSVTSLVRRLARAAVEASPCVTDDRVGGHSDSQRWISRLLIVTVTSLALQPLMAAAQVAPAVPAVVQHRPLEDVEDAVKRVIPDAWPQQKDHPARPAASDGELARNARIVLEKADAIEAEGDAVLAAFEATATDLARRNLPAEILAWHYQTVDEFKVRRDEFRRLVQAIDRAVGGKQNFLATAAGSELPAVDAAALRTATTELAAFLAKYPNKRPHTASDPNRLPWGSPKPVTREPYTTPTQFQLSRLFGEPVKVAATGTIQGITLPPPAGAIPTSADLGETEDIQLTPEIRAQAQALDNNPVKIHNWVRNTVEFIPSYGSIQGAALTLQTRRGNAFDTASLEIALLRAAGIPARYVYGSVEIPVDQVMNWVGGVTTPQAAQSLLGQGGIPNVGLVSGGTISQISLEHVWVEAWVDYIPSRGAKQVSGDTWVPLDASFKQYRTTAGMDLKSHVPLDAQALLDQVKTGATINEQEGWVQNLNQASLQTALTDYEARIKTYIDQTNPDATVGDVLGTKTIVPENHSILLGSLPYRTVTTGSRFAAIPANLQWKYRTAVSTGELDYFGDPTGSELVSLNQSTAGLAGRKITLSFIPATQADLDLISSYLPKPHADGSPIQLSELPASLPGYLLHLKAEIRVDGQIVSQSTITATMGQTLTQSTAMFNPGTQNWEEGEPNKPFAGDYHAIALDLQGTSSRQLIALKTKLDATKAKFEEFRQYPNDPTPIKDLTKEDIAGDLLYTGILGYFAGVDGADQLAARSRGNIVNYRLPSYGAFIAGAQPHYWFGIVRSVSFPGMMMDVDRVMYQVEATDNDKAKKLAYVHQVGAAGSAFEHAIPERLFADPTKPLSDPIQPQGISAVKALAIAESQGQKIYTLSQDNQAYHATLLAQMTLDADTKAEIASALAVGKEVTAHQADITVNGWTGSGYIILDPGTGAGAYKISSGMNGSIAKSCASLALAVVAVAAVTAIVAVVLLPYIIDGMVAVAAEATSVAAAITVAVAALLSGFSAIANAGESSGGQGGILCGREEECNAKLEEDDALCISIAGARYGPSGIRICQSAAMQRYSECLVDGVDGIRTPLTGVNTPI